MKTRSILTRRHVLRGMLGGAAVTVGLPLLDCFLDGNGTALASGLPIPSRFGTWFWGCGMNSSIFIPTKVGPDFDLPEEIAALQPVKQHLNLFTNFRVLTDGRPNLCHYSGWVGIRCGQAPAKSGDVPAETLDVTISDALGATTRFKSIELAATGDPKDTVSARGPNAINPPETSPLAFYQRVFGPDFQDPNSTQFKPNPSIMARKSVLSAVLEDSKKLRYRLGTDDRARLDQYFTSVRELEQRLDLQLQKPSPAEACRRPEPIVKDPAVGLDAALVAERHKMMTDTLVLALACNQTKVFNMLYSASFALTSKVGHEKNHHVVTHEEPVDRTLGYQPTTSWFVRQAMESWAYFVQALEAVREGDGTLLDRTLVFAHSDQEYAKVHSINGIPMMTAGRASGRIKTGLHVDGGGDPATRVGLTCMQAMGLSNEEFGIDAMRISKNVGEVLV